MTYGSILLGIHLLTLLIVLGVDIRLVKGAIRTCRTTETRKAEIDKGREKVTDSSTSKPISRIFDFRNFRVSKFVPKMKRVSD